MKFNSSSFSVNQSKPRVIKRQHATKRLVLFAIINITIFAFMATEVSAAPSPQLANSGNSNRNRLLESRIYSSQNQRQESKQPKSWINPCGIRYNGHGSRSGKSMVSDNVFGDLVDMTSMPRLDDSMLLKQIIALAKIAFREADSFKERYVRNVFNMDFRTHHSIWKLHTVKWLMPESIPKSLHEKTNETHLSRLELDDTLLEIYKYLQRVAIGLEQVVQSQESQQGEFRQSFKSIEIKLRGLLCEIQVAILERGLNLDDDDDDYAETSALTGNGRRRTLRKFARREPASKMHRNLRDWFIFRNYMNSLEYVIDVFEFFNGKLFDA